MLLPPREVDHPRQFDNAHYRIGSLGQGPRTSAVGLDIIMDYVSLPGGSLCRGQVGGPSQGIPLRGGWAASDHQPPSATIAAPEGLEHLADLALKMHPFDPSEGLGVVQSDHSSRLDLAGSGAVHQGT